MIGCGSMGGGMALLFAENGIHVSLSDPSEEAMDSIIKEAEKDGIQDKVQKVSGSGTCLESKTSVGSRHCF